MLRTDRVGGGFTSAVLSHHRTHGSVYGGSDYVVKPVDRIQYRDQPELIPQFLRQRLIHMRCARTPPWAVTIEGCLEARGSLSPKHIKLRALIEDARRRSEACDAPSHQFPQVVAYSGLT